ncbi:MAG TPA: WD40 repeat domain-containing protein [Ktedonobacteraceae bacterium]|nr:WD40 repeat domain-containing protein [Ktedonobacteraceae bacterium]
MSTQQTGEEAKTMQKRSAFPLLLAVYGLLLLLSGCATVQTPPTSTPTVGPSFTETTPLVMHTPLFAVNNVVWSPDGQRVAIANADGVFQVWEAATGRLISTHDDPHRSLKISILGWSADGKRIISTILGPGTTVQVWDAATGATLATFSNSYPVAASHNGKYVAVGSGSSVQIWETATSQQLSTFDTATTHVDQLAWSPDDRLLATTNSQNTADGAQDFTIQVWQAATGQRLSTYQPPAHNRIFGLTWSPDSKRIVSTEGLGPTTNAVIGRAWDATSGMPLFSLQIATGQSSGLAWSPDGARIASWYNFSSEQAAQVWDAATGKLLYNTADQAVISVAWSPDGGQIAVVDQQANMRVLEAATGQTRLTYQEAANQRSVTWSPDGRHLASVGVEGTTIWEAVADHRIASLAAHHQAERAVVWSPDGKSIAAEDGANLDAGFWDTAKGDSYGDLQIYHENMFSLFNYRNAAAVAWSPDGAHVALSWASGYTDASSAQQVYVWGNAPTLCGLDDSCPVSGGSHTAPITALAWSPDGKRIASASLDKTVLVYDVANQKNLLVYRGHTDAVTAVAWSPDGKYIASASADKTVQIWDAASGKRVLTLSGHTGTVTAVAWSPDSRRVVSSSEDGTVRTWDAVHGKLLLTYRGQSGAVITVAWSPNGHFIASAGADTTAQVWDANTGKTVFVYRGHSDAILAVAWSPDSKRVASAGADGTLQIW